MHDIIRYRAEQRRAPNFKSSGDWTKWITVSVRDRIISRTNASISSARFVRDRPPPGDGADDE